jgi:positive regulator of sigma E activity
MELLIAFVLFIVPFAIASQTGRAGLAILITTLIFIFLFTIQNMGGGHFVEALTFAFGLSMFVAVYCSLGAYVGARQYSSPSENKTESEKQKKTANDV